MYELQHIGLNKLLRLKPAIEWNASNYPALEKALELFGPRLAWVNRDTNRLLSNPAELEVLRTAKHKGDVPTILGSWPEAQEKHIALIINGGIDGLLSGIPSKDSLLSILLAYGPENFEDVLAIGPDLEYYQLILEDIANQNSIQEPIDIDNPAGWGIPDLDLSLQGETINNLVKWGTAYNKELRGKTVHFYTDDYKFSMALNYPNKLISRQPESVIEPNCSAMHNTPRAVALYQIYQKRYAASVWQHGGIRVFVDLNIDRAFFDMALMGVPPGWTAYANRAYARDLAHLEEAHALACERAQNQPINYVVYGGGKPAKELCQAHGWIWFEGEGRNGKQAADG